MIYIQIFYEFFIIGLFTFGGGYAMIPLLRQVVLDHQWLSESLFYDFIGICESTPGPIAINMATYIGSHQAGILGAIVATLAVTLPSFLIILLIAVGLKRWMQNKYVVYFLTGVKIVALGLILSTGMLLCLRIFGIQGIKAVSFDLSSTVIFCVLILLYLLITRIRKRKIGAIPLLLISAALGIVVCLII